jgi:hypothetical protein
MLFGFLNLPQNRYAPTFRLLYVLHLNQTSARTGTSSLPRMGPLCGGE